MSEAHALAVAPAPAVAPIADPIPVAPPLVRRASPSSGWATSVCPPPSLSPRRAAPSSESISAGPARGDRKRRRWTCWTRPRAPAPAEARHSCAHHRRGSDRAGGHGDGLRADAGRRAPRARPARARGGLRHRGRARYGRAVILHVHDATWAPPATWSSCRCRGGVSKSGTTSSSRSPPSASTRATRSSRRPIPRVIGGAHPGLHDAHRHGSSPRRPSSTRSSPRDGRDDQAAREHFRAVNIAMANEMADTCRDMGIDAMEIFGGGRTKPYGFIAALPRPRRRRALHPRRPLLPAWQMRSTRRSAPDPRPR